MDFDKELYCFEVETIYKSGRKRSEIIVSENEDRMWKWYDKHHDSSLILDSMIVDAWIW